MGHTSTETRQLSCLYACRGQELFTAAINKVAAGAQRVPFASAPAYINI